MKVKGRMPMLWAMLWVGCIGTVSTETLKRTVAVWKDGIPCDTVIITPIYKSYYRYDLREPLLVSYRLFHGGGKGRRSGFYENRIENLSGRIAKNDDYCKSCDGFEKGHMANAEDFARWPDSERMTFQFYNCVPQTHTLNDRIYKKWEHRIRVESNDDSLLILCGNIYSNPPRRMMNVPEDSIAIPDTCFKVVESLQSRPGKIVHVLIFPNDTSDTCDTSWDVARLQKRIGFILPLKH